MSIFARIVEEGSVSAAADKLNLSKSVLSRHLKILEQELGVVLLKRTTRSQTLTPVGETFYQSCREINLVADSAWDQAQEYQVEPKGTIRISAPTALMDILVSPLIADLMAKYPLLKPELINDDHHLNLTKDDIDLAVRVGNTPDCSLVQKRIGEFRDVLCGKADKTFRDINELSYIANSWQGKHIKHEFEAQNGERFLYEKEATCITNSFHSCLSLIKHGAGVGIIPDFYLPQLEPEVINLLPQKQLNKNPVYVICPFHKHIPLAVRTLIIALEERINAKVSRK